MKRTDERNRCDHAINKTASLRLYRDGIENKELRNGEDSVDNTESLRYNHNIFDSVAAIGDGRNTILENATLSACSYSYKDARYMVIGKVVEQ